MQVLPHTPINSLHLSTKERKALELLHVNTVEEFSQLNLERVLTLWGYGQTTYRKLARLRQKLCDDVQPQLTSKNTHALVFSDFLKLVRGRTRRALESLEVNSFEALNNITEMDVLAIPTLGTKTWKQISKLQKQYHNQITLCCETIDWTNTPATKTTVMALPLFSDHTLLISDVDLHQSYLPFRPITDIPLPEWLHLFLSQVRVHTLGELLLTPGHRLTDLNGFGKRKLTEVQTSVSEFILTNIEYTDYYSTAATYENLHKFPFFANIAQPAIRQNDIHESYKANQILKSLNLPARALHSFVLVQRELDKCLLRLREPCLRQGGFF